jgi:hypothetical protein
MTRQTIPSEYQWAVKLLRKKKKTAKEAGQLYLADLALYYSSGGEMDLLDGKSVTSTSTTELTLEERLLFYDYMSVAHVVRVMYEKAALHFHIIREELIEYEKTLLLAMGHEEYERQPKIITQEEFDGMTTAQRREAKREGGLAVVVLAGASPTLPYTPVGKTILELRAEGVTAAGYLAKIAECLSYMHAYNGIISALNEHFDIRNYTDLLCPRIAWAEEDIDGLNKLREEAETLFAQARGKKKLQALHKVFLPIDTDYSELFEFSWLATKMSLREAENITAKIKNLDAFIYWVIREYYTKE